MTQYKTYLGDAVYADFNVARQLVLTVEYGQGPVDKIVLENEVYINLLEFVKYIRQITEQQNVQSRNSS